MDLGFILTLKSQKWLKWFCCPHCGSNFPISRNGLCTNCNEPLVLMRDQMMEREPVSEFAENNTNLLMPWEIGPLHYYHTQWIQWTVHKLEIDNS